MKEFGGSQKCGPHERESEIRAHNSNRPCLRCDRYQTDRRGTKFLLDNETVALVYLRIVNERCRVFMTKVTSEAARRSLGDGL